MNHTPTPYNASYQMGRPVICKDRKILCTFDGTMSDLRQRELDAAFIVRAVNAHDELVESLKELETAARRFANGSDGNPSYVLKIAERVKTSIAKAEGKGE